MKLKNFNKFLIGLVTISAFPASIVFSNSSTQIHSSFFVENPTNDISWSIDDNGNIEPAEGQTISGEITIPDTVNGKTVTGIDNSAFYRCSSLTSINIPSSVTNIGYNAFYSCSSLTSVTFAEDSQLTSIGDVAFEDCVKLTTVNFDNDNQLTTIGKEAFFGCQSLKTIAIPSSVTSIGSNAFNDCSSLTSINIPNSVTNIDNNAFEDCDSLTDVYFNWDENQIKKLQINDCIFNSTRGQITINFYIPKGMKELYITQTKDWFDASVVPNWIDDIVPPTPTPTNSSNLALILGLIFGSIALTGIGSYLGYRYYKHRKNSKK